MYNKKLHAKNNVFDPTLNTRTHPYSYSFHFAQHTMKGAQSYDLEEIPNPQVSVEKLVNTYEQYKHNPKLHPMFIYNVYIGLCLGQDHIGVENIYAGWTNLCFYNNKTDGDCPCFLACIT